MQWQDEAVVLAVRRHGESALIASLFTREHGRHAGLVRGGASRRVRPVFQIGNRLQASWRARLPEQLGTFAAELEAATAAHLMDDPARLLALGSACALLDATLAERDPHLRLYLRLLGLLEDLLRDQGWPEDYVRFEVELLAELGFGLDLEACALTGVREGLAFVSPRSGRAVTRAAAGPWVDRLLPLPPFLLGGATADRADVLAGLRLTGAFLRRHLFDASERAMPAVRDRLLARLTPDNPR